MPAVKRKTCSDPHTTVHADQAEDQAASPDTKRRRHNPPDFTDRMRYKDSTVEEENGIILRKYYPPEIANARCKQYATGEIEKPIETLEKAIKETQNERDNIEVGESIVHWYKSDLRTRDNRSLHLASERAKSKNVPLICLYIVSPQDWEAHLTAPVRVDFVLRTLRVLKQDLAEKYGIPLYVETVEKRRNIPEKIKSLCQQWKAKHVFCNMEYEVDELRREASMVRDCLEIGVDFSVVHDTCVVEPNTLKTGAGGGISVYSPWHRKWCAYANSHPECLNESQLPSENPNDTRAKFKSLFDGDIPDAPKSKSLSKEERERYANLWPAGEEEAYNRLHKFLKERIKQYHNTRNVPGENGTSVLSPHLAAGTLAARTAVREALAAAKATKLTDNRQDGTMLWCGEVAWRDFYKHVLCHWPFVCMNKCFKPEYTDIEWEYDQGQFEAWTQGKTGFPIVDAAMRQCHHMAYIHNRCRMIVASFLAKDLMLDWRMGERWFMEHLIDGDFASNNGGWGFSASCGVDPQPYFRIFNPLLQSEKFDECGDYIRKWVPELKAIQGKAIHDPYNRGAEVIARKNGYPKPIVDHKAARERALSRYKTGLGRTTA